MLNTKELILNKAFQRFDSEMPNNNRLVIILGSLGDFDSIEYIQNIVKFYDRLISSKISLFAIGIGDTKSKDYFCSYTGFPIDRLIVFQDNNIHEELGLSRGLTLSVNSWINMLLMCVGIGSPGTLKEVLRGYTGDYNATSIFNNDIETKYLNNPLFKINPFQLLGVSKHLRPFELATLRLNNLIEVMLNWNTYFSCTNYITQRGATFLLDSEGKIIYSFYPTSVLGYTEDMSDPLEFLYKYL